MVSGAILLVLLILLILLDPLGSFDRLIYTCKQRANGSEARCLSSMVLAMAIERHQYMDDLLEDSSQLSTTKITACRRHREGQSLTWTKILLDFRCKMLTVKKSSSIRKHREVSFEHHGDSHPWKPAFLPACQDPQVVRTS